MSLRESDQSTLRLALTLLRASRLKTKITTQVVISVFVGKPKLGGDFAHRLDALGAQNLVNLVTLFHHNRFLQVGSEGTIGGALGK